VVLDFWATWCKPCLESLPHLEKDFQNKALADKGLKIYAVNCQETADGVAAFIKKNNFTFNVALDPDQTVEKAYLVSGIPATVIIGKDGTIEHVVVGYNEAAAKEIDDAVNAALAK
jgi:thiol-disulfide isomerase/thioredoxin